MKTSMVIYFGIIALVLVFTVELAVGQACNSGPCQNGGICLDLGSQFICQCTSDFSGDTCGTAGAGAACVFNSCANGGTCVITDGVIECKCTSEYTGPTCETSVDAAITTNTPSTTPTPQTTSGFGSNDDPSTVDLWIIIAIAVAVAIIVILVVLLIIGIVFKGKSRRKTNRSSNRNPHMIAEFRRDVPESDSANSVFESPVHSNMAYDATKLDAFDYPPPDYDGHSINGFRIPEPRIYDNKQTADDYFTKSDVDGFEGALY